MHALKIKKGFVFTLVTLAVFTLLLSMIISYLDTAKLSRAASLPDIEKTFYLRDDVADDFQAILGVRVYAARGAMTEVHFVDELPSEITDLKNEMKKHAEVLEGYARSTNSKITIDVSEMERAPRVEIPGYNLTYSFDFEKKNINLSAQGAKGVKLALVLDGTCEGDCVSGDWNWKEEGVFVELKIRDKNGKAIDVFGKTSGYVDVAEKNSITIRTTTGELTISSSGERDRLEMGLGVSGLRAATDVGISFPEDKEVKARVPISARIEAGEAGSDSEIVIYEN